MRYVTRAKVDSLSSMAGKTDAQRAQVVADSRLVLDYIKQNEWIEDHTLRQFGEANGFPPARLNPALEFLIETAQLYRLAEPGDDLSTPASTPPAAPQEPETEEP